MRRGRGVKVSRLIFAKWRVLIECFLGAFKELGSYANEPADGKTIGKVSHKVVGEKEVEFTVEAMVVKIKAEVGGERSEL
jgi:hypothetical protein